MSPARLLPVAAGALVAGAALFPPPAEATPPCGRGWRKGEWCGGPAVVVAPPPPVFVAPRPPVAVAPAPLVAVPPPPPAVVVAPAPPPVFVAPSRPSIGLHVEIPLR
ncbi:hypothetical protein GCM10010964_36220 [Caldovatus sediminis]|uniref:Uncharacterized protein n=1 Tax=Caldovatus sediminis TaxID=2041189 RepID=A0A8J3EEU3_9PROT|nr:hypothetical protein [Caldovatus sediminis]GGG45579.1 hypothetical protein GCM10010964_36220 [Caldovatus sediminis]